MSMTDFFLTEGAETLPPRPVLDGKLAKQISLYFPASEPFSLQIALKIEAILLEHHYTDFGRLRNIARAFHEHPDDAREKARLTSTERLVWSKLRDVTEAHCYEYDQVSELFSSVDIFNRTPLEPPAPPSSATPGSLDFKIPRAMLANLKKKEAEDPSWRGVTESYFDLRLPRATLKDPSLVKDGHVQCVWCDASYKCAFDGNKIVFHNLHDHLEKRHKLAWPVPQGGSQAASPASQPPQPVGATMSASTSVGGKRAFSSSEEQDRVKRLYKQQQLVVTHRPRASLVTAIGPAVIDMTQGSTSTDHIASGPMNSTTSPAPASSSPF
jgi:hypothetical protein